MDIQNLKRECNLLIDEVIRLQEKEKVLDEKISMLQEEIQGLASGKVNEKGAGKTDERLPEELEHTEEEMGGIIEPVKSEEPAESEEASEAEESVELEKPEEIKEILKLNQSAEVRKPAGLEDTAICEKEEPVPETEEMSEPELQALLKDKKEMPQGGQNRFMGGDKDCREELLSSGEASSLPQEEEKRLARQVSLLTGETGKEIVIVYERPDRLQKVKDLLKTVIFIVMMLFIVAAAVLLLYYGAEKGAIQEYVF